MSLDLEVRAGGAVPTGAKNVGASTDPTDGGLNVHIAGGTVTIDESTLATSALQSSVGATAHTDSGLVLAQDTTTATQTTAAAASLVSILADTADIETSVASLDAKTVAVNTGAVVVASSALPTGAATEAGHLAAIDATLDDIEAQTVGLALDATVGLVLARLAQGRLADAGSVGVALSTEDIAVLNALGSQTTLDLVRVAAQAILAKQPASPALESGGNLATIAAAAAYMTAPLSLADTTATGSPAALASLVAGPGGILVTALPMNPVGSIVRVSGADVGVSQGQPLGPGASFVWRVANANQLKIIIGSGTAPAVAVSQA